MKILKKYSDIIVIGCLWIVSAFSIISNLNQQLSIGIQNYLGYILLLLVTFLRYRKISRLKFYLVGILLLGTFNLIQFTISTTSVGFGFKAGGFETETIGFQPLSFLLLTFLLFMHFTRVMQLLLQK